VSHRSIIPTRSGEREIPDTPILTGERKNDNATIHCDLKPDDLIVITGAGGFIGGSLVRYFWIEQQYKARKAGEWVVEDTMQII
jgi:hypothetical protein